MTTHWQSTPEDYTEIRAWFEQWGALVRAQDFETARTLFVTDIAAFGTHIDVVEGLSQLEAQQWRQVWPTIAQFDFVTDALKLAVSSDGLMAVGLCPWQSTGYLKTGETFDRPGRASVAFVRAAHSAPWKGMHTHFSLAPGTPQRSYGAPT